MPQKSPIVRALDNIGRMQGLKRAGLWDNPAGKPEKKTRMSRQGSRGQFKGNAYQLVQQHGK